MLISYATSAFMAVLFQCSFEHLPLLISQVQAEEGEEVEGQGEVEEELEEELEEGEVEEEVEEDVEDGELDEEEEIVFEVTDDEEKEEN